jgi:prolyl-tRNA synthetase
MADKITPRSQDFSQWYQDIVVQAKLADYSPVKGCMVIRPNGYAIWEAIQRDLDRRIKATGVRNAYFPLFIPESFLKKEAEHVEGFAPQCAVVTYAGAKDLEEKLVVRPTSETIINSMFAKWIQSYRDLPLLINQWANVVRWEMRTRLFLRTTEFLWQEGHTCHATLEEAEDEARLMLKVYTDFAEEVLAMPVFPGQKSESEKFAGALRTYSIEAMMQDKKALQAGTSHNLTDNFAKAFETQFLDKDGKQKHVHQTSWGVSTRLIGGMIMTHSDDKGLVLPPRLAHTHVAIVPIMAKAETKAQVIEAADNLAAAITAQGEGKGGPWNHPIHVTVDKDETKQPGWKFFEYELLGIPVRIEIGPRDLEKGQAVLTRRDEGKKEFLPLDAIPKKVNEILAAMQKDLLERARAFREANTFRVESYDEFKKKIEDGGFFIAPWCQSKECEAKVKDETKATIRCLPLDAQFKPYVESGACMACGTNGKSVRAVFARSY